jgi:hypothetical protein
MCLIFESAVCNQGDACAYASFSEIARQQANKTSDATAIPSKFQKAFAGPMSDTLNIHVYIIRNGESIIGGYYYWPRSGEPFLITYTSVEDGTIDEKGILAFTGRNIYGKPAETFIGKLSSEVVGGKQTLRFEGLMTSTDGSKQIPLSLIEQHPNLSDELRVQSKRIEKEDRETGAVIEAEFPQIVKPQSAAVSRSNQKVRSLIFTEIFNYTKDVKTEWRDRVREYGLKETKAIASEYASSTHINYHIVTATRDLLSVYFHNTYSIFGGAHPSHHSFALNFDLKTGRQIRLADLFKPNSNYLKIISRHCIKAMTGEEQTENEEIKRGASPSLANYAIWNLNRDSLLITFERYQVAAYSAGEPEVVIPFEAIKNIINPRGPIPRLIRQAAGR